MGFQKMKRATLILITIIALSACSTTKEMRRANRASKKLEKLVIKYPELAHPDTLRIPITLRTPIIQGRIESRMTPITRSTNRDFPNPIRLIDDAPIQTMGVREGHFEDDTLKAKVFLYDDGRVVLDYHIKPLAIDSSIEHVFEKIQPVEFKPMPQKWWELALQSLGMLFIIIIAILLALRTLKPY
jgi:ribosomal protein L32